MITINILICQWKTWPLVVITEITISLRYAWVTNIQGISSKTIPRCNNNTYTLSHRLLWNTKMSKWKYSQYHLPWKHNVYYGEWRHNAKSITIGKITQRFVSFEFALIVFHASVSKSLSTNSMSFQYLMDQSHVFDGVLMRYNSYLISAHT